MIFNTSVQIQSNEVPFERTEEASPDEAESTRKGAAHEATLQKRGLQRHVLERERKKELKSTPGQTTNGS